MPAKNPRIMVVLEKPLYKAVGKKAQHDGVSLSTEMRDLVREALEEYEDVYWAKEGDKRLTGLNRRKLISHKDFWKRAGL